CTIRDTIFAGSASNQNCTGSRSIVAEDHNLDSGNTCGLLDPSDLTDTDPMLGPLQDNCGPTMTLALLPGSPAIDAGSPSCPPPSVDQRGTPRPQPSGGRCDIGAYELAPGTSANCTTTTTTTTVGQPTVTTTTVPCATAGCTLGAAL